MNITLFNYIQLLCKSPLLIVISLIVFGALLTNGMSDAPNSIATSVSTRSIKLNRALFLAGLFNFIGLLVMCIFNNSVASTVINMVNFGENYQIAIIGLSSALVSILLWTLATWYFSIPTSQSHALIAGLVGSAIACTNSFSSINLNELLKVFLGIAISIVLGFGIGFIVTKIFQKSFKNVDRRKANKFFKKSQVAVALLSSFVNGAQDGQKFIGIFILGIFLAQKYSIPNSFDIPIWMIIISGFLMALGLLIGGKKIVKTVGTKMSKLEPYEGVASDISSRNLLINCFNFWYANEFISNKKFCHYGRRRF